MVKSGEKPTPKKETTEADASVTKKAKKDKKRKSVVAAETVNGTADPAPEAAAEEQPPSEKKQKKRKADEASEAAAPVPQEQLKKRKKKKNKEADQVDEVASPAPEPAAGEAAVQDADTVEAEGAPEAEAVVRPTSQYLIPIADPLADPKLTKKVLKLAKKASQRKQIKRGVKEVVKALRKKFKGICILAGDISPIDVITHIPILCEDSGIPYIYVPSKEALGAAALTKRPTSCMLVLPKPIKGTGADDAEAKEFAELYESVRAKIAAVEPLYMKR